MIADTIENLKRYYGLHPNLDVLIEGFDSLDLSALEDGRHEIRGKDVYLNLAHPQLAETGFWEAHREYIDVQLILENEETIAWAPIEDIHGFSGYDEEKDIMKSDDSQQGARLLLKRGMFAIFFPEDAHQPGLGQGSVRKAVFKLKARPSEAEPRESSGGLNHLGTRELHTRRLKLRPFTQDDAETMYKNWCSDPEVAQTLEWDAHPDAGFTRLLLGQWVKAYKSPQCYHWGIEQGGELIGDIAVMSQSFAQSSCEIGYCLSRKHWNKGIMTEALIGVLRFLFSEVGFRRVMLRHAAENPASGMVMRKAGLKEEGVSREMLKNKQGTFSDIVQYAALRDEWLSRRQGTQTQPISQIF